MDSLCRTFLHRVYRWICPMAVLYMHFLHIMFTLFVVACRRWYFCCCCCIFAFVLFCWKPTLLSQRRMHPLTFESEIKLSLQRTLRAWTTFVRCEGKEWIESCVRVYVIAFPFRFNLLLACVVCVNCMGEWECMWSLLHALYLYLKWPFASPDRMQYVKYGLQFNIRFGKESMQIGHIRTK